MMNLRRIACGCIGIGIVAIGLAARSNMALAAEGPAARAPEPPPILGEPVIDAAMTKLASQTELAVVQYEKLRDLAAKTAKATNDALKEPLAKVQDLQAKTAGTYSPEEAKLLAGKIAAAEQELEAAKSAQRERLSWAVVDLLYPDQVELFLEAYEHQIGEPAGPAHKMARSRLKVIMGYQIPPLEGPQQMEVMLALLKYYGPVYKELSELESAYKGRLADKQVAAECQAKRDAIVKQSWAKSLEIVNSLLTPEQRQAVVGEWLRLRDRRANMALRELGRQYAPKTDAQKKQVETLSEAFRAASRSLDIEDPAYATLREKLEKDVDAATKE